MENPIRKVRNSCGSQKPGEGRSPSQPSEGTKRANAWTSDCRPPELTDDQLRGLSPRPCGALLQCPRKQIHPPSLGHGAGQEDSRTGHSPCLGGTALPLARQTSRAEAGIPNVSGLRAAGRAPAGVHVVPVFGEAGNWATFPQIGLKRKEHLITTQLAYELRRKSPKTAQREHHQSLHRRSLLSCLPVPQEPSVRRKDGRPFTFSPGQNCHQQQTRAHKGTKTERAKEERHRLVAEEGCPCVLELGTAALCSDASTGMFLLPTSLREKDEVTRLSGSQAMSLVTATRHGAGISKHPSAKPIL